MPEQTTEVTNSIKLNARQLGHLAEMAFMRKAASLGFTVAKPWADSERYDVIIRFGTVLWRIQVKSTNGKMPSRQQYRVKTTGGKGTNYRPYSPDELDFLVIYIIPEDTWYVFPVSVIESRSSVCLGRKNSEHEQYREAWGLLRPSAVNEKTPESAVSDPAVPPAKTATGAASGT